MRRVRWGPVLLADRFGIRFLGLMGRTRWPAGHRGIFFPRCRALHTCFTFLKPDIVFVDKKNRILQVIPSAPSWRFWSGPPGTQHCLEVPSGALGLPGAGERMPTLELDFIPKNKE